MKQSVLLSGLLNAINSVTTYKGRVFVMTINHLKKLDEALICFGRIDMQIEFMLVIHNQI